MVLLALISLANATCESVGDALDDAQGEVLDFELDLARERLAEAEVRLGCDWANAADLGRYWLIEGVAAYLDEDATVGAESFQAAARVGASWNADFGEKLASSFAAAQGAHPATGELSVTPATARVFVDGTPWKGAPLPAGLHLVQVGAAKGPPVLTRMVRIDAATTVELAADLPETPVPSGLPTRAPRDERVELRVSAAGAVYGRFQTAGFGGVAPVLSAPLAGSLRVSGGAHALLGRHRAVGLRALAVLRAGVELALLSDALRVGASAVVLPQDLGWTAGGALTVGIRREIGSDLDLHAEALAGWSGGLLVTGGAGVGVRF